MGSIKLIGKMILLAVLAAGGGVRGVQAASPEIHGFLSTDAGWRPGGELNKRQDYHLLESRLQLWSLYYFEGDHYLAEKSGVINAKGDFTLDGYFGGQTVLDLREMNLALTPLDWMDVKAGRQILTWGTGDYLFINDLFPKDYVSFYSGREDEYLKKPSDALKMSFYPEWGNWDVVVTRFEPNTLPKGDRLSFFDMFQGGITGRESDRHLEEPSSDLTRPEYHVRYYRGLGAHQLALYFLHGFDKNPTGTIDEAQRRMFYPRLDVYGSSLRGPWAGGIGNLEGGYYYSRQDSDGTSRLIENSFFKVMTGYQKDLGNDWSLGAQYQYEQRLDYGNYQENLLPGDFVFDETRHLLTQRITKLYRQQTIMVSIFNFYSPSDKDGYFRPSVTCDVNDHWKVTLGGNLPWGEDNITTFGQMKKNKNAYVRVKYSF